MQVTGKLPRVFWIVALKAPTKNQTRFMNISGSTLISSLQTALPEFEINPDWVEDSLGYPTINDLARFTCQQAATGNINVVERILSFLETGLQEQDPYVRDLVLEFLETLRACDKTPEITSYFGQETRSLWNRD